MSYEAIQAMARIESVIRVISDNVRDAELGPMHEFMISNLEDVKAFLERR